MFGRISGIMLVFVISLFALFALACSDNKSVSSYSQEIRTDDSITITFNEPIIEENATLENGTQALKAVLPSTEADKKIVLNGESIFAQYSYLSPYELTIVFPQGALKPNTKYKLELKLDKLESSRLKDTLNLEFRTLPTQIHTSQFAPNFISDTSFNFELNVSFSQPIVITPLSRASETKDFDTLRKAISLQDESGKELEFSIGFNTYESSLLIQSQNLAITDKPTRYTLTLKADYFGLQKDEVLHYERVSEGLEIVDIQAISSEKSHIQVHFSQPLADNKDIKDFISLSPNLKTTAIIQGNILQIYAPFNITQNYTLKVKEGIAAVDKSLLKDSKEEQIVFNQIAPSIVFSQQGVFLPSQAEKKIAFKSINVKKVKLKISKIYPNNITAYLHKQNLIGSTKYSTRTDYDDYYDDYGESSGIYADFERLGDVVFEQDFALNMQKNQWIQTQLDFSALKANEGIFILELSFDKDGVDYDFPKDTSSWRQEQFFNQFGKIQKHLIFSNIALLAQQIDNKLEVLALDIASNKPLPQVQINAINQKNQIVAKSTSNAQGLSIFENANTIMYLNATQGKNTTILRFNSPLSLEGFDTQGLESTSNVNAYIYTDRGVYRPGEVAHINIIARSNNASITHPISISITSPQGKVVLEDFMLKEQLFGLYHYDFKSEKSAPTGIWRVKLKIGNAEFWHNLSIESVVSDRIRAEILSPDTLSLQTLQKNDKTLFYDINSSYLFGAPAADLKFESDLYVQGVNFSAKAYPNYTFTHPSSLQYSFNDGQEGILDAKGFSSQSFSLKNLEDMNKNLRAFIHTKIFENGGRYVSARKMIDIALYDSFVGIKTPSAYVSANNEIALPVIVLSHDTQKPLSNRQLTYRIYQNSYSWWWDYDSYNEFLRSFKQDKNTKLIKQGKLTSALEPTLLRFTPHQNGELFIEVEDESNHQKSAVILYASESGEPTDAPKLTQLQIKSDKQNYLSNEKAKISFESAKDSKALISIVRGNTILQKFWLDTQEGQTSFELPLKESFAPNVYVAITLLQNYATLDNDRSQRLYGVLPIMVENAESKLSLDIQAPDSIRPNTEFKVKLSNAQKQKSAYTLAIVDEGLLNLTDFVSPNPWAYFYQKMAFMLSVFDNYDLIISRDIGTMHQILKVGGDEFVGASHRKDLNQAQRFKPVVFYSKPVMSDESGNAEFSYIMPAYMGSVRIMAVGVNEKAYGSKSQNMKIIAPVVMLPTLPRSLKIGDSFELAIEVLPIQENVGKTTLKLKSGDKIKLEKNNITLEFKDKKSQIVKINAKVSEESIGQDFIEISLANGDFKMSDVTHIDILPNNPYTTISQKHTLSSKQKLSLENPKNYIKDSESSYILVSQKPIMSIDHRLSWLIRYPYGCIEQTTSSVMPQLFLGVLGEADFIDKPSIVKNINAGIARISTFQTSDGGFAYWQGESKSDSWGSAYAGHFLLLAKNQGYYVPESVLKKWINYAIYNAQANGSVYLLYLLSLAGEPQIGLLNNVYEHHLSKLEISDKWLLAAAYKLAGMEEIAHKITKDLPTKAKQRDSSYYDFSYGSTLRDDAMILNAYGDIYKTPHKELLSYILGQLESDKWYSTQTLGYSLLAIANTIPKEQKEAKNFSFKFDGKSYESADSIKLPFNGKKAEFVSQSDFPLYVNHIWDGILEETDIKASADKIAIDREFLDTNGKPIDVSTLASGQSFYLMLSLKNADNNTPVSVRNVAITQNLPSGWEIENTRLNDDNLPDFVRDDHITYTDIGDDKIMWFLDFHSQSRKMFVKINTITPGSYLLPPATAEAMYDNNFRANTASMPVMVK
ncbi:alpha-2-macroglobulin family protein [Helicobacter labetoulli]|uniref:alpha-2-macroglobulin family protein n=1 Tax=Helicobacter labetoulli TaxID=2315333 RepID=UPI000EF6E4D1|nr:MG2 domain-containing protein [Helicobacter labetoulli]